MSLHFGLARLVGLGGVGFMAGITVGVLLSFMVLGFMARRSEADGRVAFIGDLIDHYALRLLYIFLFLRDIFLLLLLCVHQSGTLISECQGKSFRFLHLPVGLR